MIKKYIDRQPLTKAQQTYLNKTGKRAIAAGLAALGIGAAAILGTMGYKHATRTPEEIFTSYGITFEDDTDRKNALALANTIDLPRLLQSKNIEYRDAYITLGNTYPQFKEALAKIRGVKVENLPAFQTEI